jgi:hypothetical protein
MTDKETKTMAGNIFPIQYQAFIPVPEKGRGEHVEAEQPAFTFFPKLPIELFSRSGNIRFPALESSKLGPSGHLIVLVKPYQDARWIATAPALPCCKSIPRLALSP